jgi:hypothetical protein
MCTIALLAFVLFRIASAAESVDYFETWPANGLGGWTLDRPEASLTNEAGHLLISFGEQTNPEPSACVVEYDLDPGISVTNLSFRLRAEDRLPSSARLYLRSAEVPDTWYVPLTGLVAGAWVEYTVPVTFGPRWKLGPTGNEARFLKAMRTVGKVGIYIRRHGARSRQRYGLDDFNIQGIKDIAPVSIAGVVSYAGAQGGPVRIEAISAESGHESASAVLLYPAAYRLEGVQPSAGYRVLAYRDSNDNRVRDFWEASGTWTGGVAAVSWSPVGGIDVLLTEPLSADGMPLWWLRRYFGITAPDSASDEAGAAADDDPDLDGMSNFGEYRAGTDPHDPLSSFIVTAAAVDGSKRPQGVVLTWGAATNRTYGVYRSDSPLRAPSLVRGGISSTPPLNVYQDWDATNAGPYFYRVVVEE